MEIAGKIALVSGAGSGIGRATALALAAAGAQVVVSDIDGDAAERAAGEIAAVGGESVAVAADVGSEHDIRRMLATAERVFGALHILDNNAGILAAGPRFPHTPPERFMRVVDVNLRGVLLATYHAIPLMARSGGGVIIQTASSAALGPHPQHPVYAATKAGVLNFTRSLTHLQEEFNIRVNCVCPGLVRTGLVDHAAELMTREERDSFLRFRSEVISPRDHLDPADVARAVLDLVRDDNLNGRACLLLPGRDPEIL